MCVRFANQIVTFSVPWGQCVSVWTGALYQRGLQMETKIFGGFIFKSTSWQELHFLLAIIPDKFLEHNEPKWWHNPVNVWITPEENQWVWAHPKEWKEVSIEIFLLWPLCAIVIPARKIAFKANELRSTVDVNSNIYNCSSTTNLVIKARTRNKPHADGSWKEMQSFDITFQVGYAKFAERFA